MNIVLTCIDLVLSFEPVEFIVHVHSAPVKPCVWFDCSVPAPWQAKPEVGLIVIPCRFESSKARGWVDCSVPAAWKTAKIASPSKARGWVVCALNIVLTCVVLVLSYEPVEFIVHGVHCAW